MAKTRIGERLVKSAHFKDKARSTAPDKSVELDESIKKFDEFFNKTLKPLAAELKGHHEELKKLQKTEKAVTMRLTQMIEESPIDTEDTNPIVLQKDLCKVDEDYTTKFGKVVEYVHEWEVVVDARVKARRKPIAKLRKDCLHYEKKLASLTKKMQANAAKGKPETIESLDKLQRNEEKASMAKEAFQAQANGLVELLDETVTYAWKDLLPMLVRMAEMRHQHVLDEYAVVEATTVVESMKRLAEDFQIDLTEPPPGLLEQARSLPPNKNGDKKAAVPEQSKTEQLPEPTEEENPANDNNNPADEATADMTILVVSTEEVADANKLEVAVPEQASFPQDEGEKETDAPAVAPAEDEVVLPPASNDFPEDEIVKKTGTQDVEEMAAGAISEDTSEEDEARTSGPQEI